MTSGKELSDALVNLSPEFQSNEGVATDFYNVFTYANTRLKK